MNVHILLAIIACSMMLIASNANAATANEIECFNNISNNTPNNRSTEFYKLIMDYCKESKQ